MRGVIYGRRFLRAAISTRTVTHHRSTLVVSSSSHDDRPLLSAAVRLQCFNFYVIAGRLIPRLIVVREESPGLCCYLVPTLEHPLAQQLKALPLMVHMTDGVQHQEIRIARTSGKAQEGSPQCQLDTDVHQGHRRAKYALFVQYCCTKAARKKKERSSRMSSIRASAARREDPVLFVGSKNARIKNSGDTRTNDDRRPKIYPPHPPRPFRAFRYAEGAREGSLCSAPTGRTAS